MLVNEALRAWREEQGLSQSQCAAACKLSQPTWSDYEKGTKQPKVGAAGRIEKLTKGKIPMRAWGTGVVADPRRRRRRVPPAPASSPGVRAGSTHPPPSRTGTDG